MVNFAASKQRDIMTCKIYASFLFLFILILTAGCGEIGADREAREALERADAVLDAMPDSAMAIIAGIDTARLNTERLRADYSLLRTMALLKTDPSAATEEGLKAAYDYYGDSDEPSRQTMLTHFAKSGIAEQCDSTHIMISELKKCIDLAEGPNCTTYKGMAQLNMGNAYHSLYNSIKEREWIDKGMKTIVSTKDTANIIHAYIVSATAFTGDGDCGKAILELQKGLDLASGTGDKNIEKRLLTEIAYNHSLNNRHSEAASLYDSIARSGYKLSEPDINAYAMSAYLASSQPDKKHIAIPPINSESAKASYFNALAQMYLTDGDYRSAYTALDSVVGLQNAELGDVAAKNHHLQNQLEETAIKLQVLADKKEATNRLLIVFEALTALLSAVLLAASWKYWRKRHKKSELLFETKECDYKMEIDSIKDEKNTLEEKNRDILYRLIREEQTLSEIGKLSEAMTLFTKKNNEIQEKFLNEFLFADNDDDESKELDYCIRLQRDELAKNFKMYHSTIARYWKKMPKGLDENGKEEFCKKREEALAAYRDSDYLASLEKLIDTFCENVIGNLRKSHKITEEDIKWVIYDICGLNYTCTGIIMGVSESAASTKRTRIKKLLTEFNDSDKSLFLRHIPMMH